MKLIGKLSSIGRPGWKLVLKENGRGGYTLGRHPTCSLVLTDMHISTKHLSLECDTEKAEVILTDTSS